MKVRSFPVLALTMIVTLFGVAATWYVIQPIKKAPRATFHLLDGRTLDIRQLEGRPVLVLFWATTCKICIEEIPQVKKLYREYQKIGFELIAVTMPYDPPLRVKIFSKRLRLPYLVAVDVSGKVVNAFKDVPGTPTSFLISPSGYIVDHQIGRLDFAVLREKIKNL